MYIVVGLGNPGQEYVGTRHNIGFETADAICSKYDVKMKSSKFKAQVGEFRIGTEKILLVKPQTFMNLSGEAVREIMDYYDVDNENLIVIYDDISLPTGKIRIREKGSAGGHNGIKNIIYQLGSDKFPRIKIGVGAPEHPDFDMKDYVLGRFSKEEIEILIKTVIKATDALEEIIRVDALSAMSKFNG
ncbi:MAG: aminoacyl-tRNA hydrolase [Oscillospiraceae bacterium]